MEYHTHENDMSELVQKRLRNRASQQAFRRRQAAYIKDLERQLEMRGASEDDQIAVLQNENRSLRRQLATAINKLEGVQATLKSLSSSMAGVIQLEGKASDDWQTSSPKSEPAARANLLTAAPPKAQQVLEAPEYSEVPSDTSIQTNLPIWQESEISQCQSAQWPPEPDFEVMEQAWRPIDPWSAEPHMLQNDGAQAEEHLSFKAIPGIWSYQYQMGPEIYRNRMQGQCRTQSDTSMSNSSFTDHIQIMQRSITEVWKLAGPQMQTSARMKWLRLSITVMLSMFNSLSRPGALMWYTATNFSKNITDLVLWRMCPSRETYSRLHTNYRPSALQSSEIYPSIIDWCPFPTIRDKLILLHAANPCLDTIICDVAAAYSVNVDTAVLVSGYNGQGFIRIWDLICAMGSIDSVPELIGVSRRRSEDLHGNPVLPAPDIETLFTPMYAQLAFRRLSLDDGVPRFKLDPLLFIQYPELYDPAASIMASGIALAPAAQTGIPSPIEPGMATKHIYRHFAMWCVRAFLETQKGESQNLEVW